MKKKLLSFIFGLCLIIPCVFMLSACGTKKEVPARQTIEGVTYELFNKSSEYKVVDCVSEMENIDILQILNNKPVTTIGRQAFYRCSLESITIPDSVTTIGDDAFYLCESLESVTIGNGVTEIGNYAFMGCTYLNDLTIGNNVEIIKDGAFSSCVLLENITIPSSVTTMGAKVFNECYSLTSIIIPNGVTTIGERAFYRCDSLESVTIPNSVTTIGRNAFYNCAELVSITIPNSVTTIGERAFHMCYSLKSITIPNSVTTIGDAFSGCIELKEVIIDSESITNNLVDINEDGSLIRNATSVYIKTGLTVTNSTYLLENFTKQATSDKAGYDMYVRNA